MIDTHTHIDAEDFLEDVTETIQRALERGIEKMFLPAIDYPSSLRILEICREFHGVCYPMLGLHPEEVKDDWADVVEKLTELEKKTIDQKVIAVGEVGLDFYWSREYESEQLAAFEKQIEWSIDRHLPLMIHCRKAQNEMVKLLRRYEKELCGGVFHCFTGNDREALELLQFENFSLGIGGIFTFKKSPLPSVLPTVVPLSRIVLETDSPYMAPVPHRGKRNEPMYVHDIALRIAEAYSVSLEELNTITNENVRRIFGV